MRCCYVGGGPMSGNGLFWAIMGDVRAFRLNFGRVYATSVDLP